MRTAAFYITVLLLCACAGSSGAAEPARVVLVLAGNLSFRDVADADLPALSTLLREGSPALMNVRTGRSSRDMEPASESGLEAGCLTLGAGAMASGGAEVRRACDAAGTVNDVPASAIYGGRTGRDYPPDAVLHTEIVRIRRINAAASYRARPGALGFLLRAAGIETAVIGSSDLPGEIHREAAAVAMDDWGVIDRGEVDSPRLREADPASPYGVRTNTALLLREMGRALRRSRFVVLDFGDTFRADNYANTCSDEQGARLRGEAVARLDHLLTQISARLDFERDMLIVLSPSPRTFTDLNEERLVPIIIRGPGFGGGMLTSPSTRRDGVVTISDVAPTILRFFGLDPSTDMVGRPISRVAAPAPVDTLLALNADASRQAQRQVAMRGASVVQSVIVAVVTLMLLVSVRGLPRSAALWAALVPIGIPIVMLYLPVVYSGGLAGSVLWLVALTVGLLALCALVIRSALRAFAVLCGAMVLSLVVDLLRGAPLVSSSIAGYSLVEGARYYGVGNELMGTMLGAALVCVGVLAPVRAPGGRVRELLTAAALVLVFVFIGAPALGANVGGAIATAPAIAVAMLVRRGWRPSVRGVVLVAVVTVVVVGGLLAADSIRGGASQSHMGRVMEMAASGEPSGLLSVFHRKIALNFMLLSHSLWSRLLGLSLAASAVLLWWGGRRGGTGKLLTRELRAAAAGCLVGTVGAFAFNDSGVLAAATCSVLLWSLLALRVFGGETSEKPEDRYGCPPAR